MIHGLALHKGAVCKTVGLRESRAEGGVDWLRDPAAYRLSIKVTAPMLVVQPARERQMPSGENVECVSQRRLH